MLNLVVVPKKCAYRLKNRQNEKTMTELLTAAQMRDIENAAIESGEVTGLELMERAGRGVLEAILAEWPEMATTAQKAVVLCGPGNNGGDGFVVARLLKQRGWVVEVFLYGEVEKLPPDAKANAERWLERGEVDSVGGNIEELSKSAECADIFVDALFGIGLTRPLPPVFAPLGGLLGHGVIDRYNGQDTPITSGKVVAIDMPSGICADSGKIIGDFAFHAKLAVTFERCKFGHHLAAGPAHCGKLAVVPIGISDQDIDAYFEIGTLHPFARLTGKPSRLNKQNGHKYNYGHALILSGPAGAGGAARLSARGALRIGAGLVSLGCPHEALAENAARLDAIMLKEIGTAAALENVLNDGRITTLCLGPGMGLTARTREMVEVALKSGRKTVLDADALSAFKSNPQALFDLLHKDVVITPHMGEVRSLIPDMFELYQSGPLVGPAISKHNLALVLAEMAGCTVLLKGADTVVAKTVGSMAYSSTHSAHYERAAPWLATAGSGDVLAGYITGLLARGFAPMQAAETAAWLHVECALKFGPGLIAEDLPEQLPAVFRDLNL